MMEALVINEESLCSLAKRIPSVRRTGNLLVDNQNEHDRRCFQLIEDTLAKKPELIQALYGNLINLLSSSNKQGRAEEFESVSTLGKLDETWCASFLTKHSKLTMENIGSMKAVDPLVVYSLMQYASQLPLSAKLFAEMVVKVLASAVLGRRHRAVGLRLNSLTSTCMTDGGAMNWANFSHTLIFEGESVKAAHVLHSSGTKVPLPDYVVITRKFTIESNFDDSAASAVLGAAVYKLDTFFEQPLVGPHAYPLWAPKSTMLKDVATEEKTKHTQSEQVVGEVVIDIGDTAVLKTASKAKRCAAAEKARAAAFDKSRSLKKARRVSVCVSFADILQ